MLEEYLSDEKLISLLTKMQAHFEIMIELGSEDEVDECRLLVQALSELKEFRKATKDGKA